MSKKITDLTGKKYGKLTVIERTDDYVSPKGRHVPKWLCRCECGKQVAVIAHSLTSGATATCGCNKGWRSVRNIGSKAKIWHMKAKNKWIVNVRVGTFDSLGEATAARDKANKMFNQ